MNITRIEPMDFVVIDNFVVAKVQSVFEAVDTIKSTFP